MAPLLASGWAMGLFAYFRDGACLGWGAPNVAGSLVAEHRSDTRSRGRVRTDGWTRPRHVRLGGSLVRVDLRNAGAPECDIGMSKTRGGAMRRHIVSLLTVACFAILALGSVDS